MMLCLLVSALTLSTNVLLVVGACFLHLFAGDFAIENGRRRAAEVLPRVPMCKKALLLLTEKTRVADKLHLGMRYSAIGYEFNVNEPTIY